MTDHTIAGLALLLLLLSLFSWGRHARLLRAALVAANAQLDEAHLAAAALSADHGSPAVWRRRAQAALRAGEIADERRIADACAAVAAHGARELERHVAAAERSLADALGPHCSSCGNAIDEDWCHCGSAVAAHGRSDGHSPVPMGCVCGYDDDREPDWKKIAEARHLIAWQLRDERDSRRGWLARTVRIARGLRADRDRLTLLINTPRTDEFFEAVRIESAHQVERWGVEHDAGKRSEDWIALFIYLLGKAARAHYDGDRPKLEHHVITSAAVALNWWRHLTGVSTAMRPGVVESDNQRMDALDRFCEARGLNR